MDDKVAFEGMDLFKEIDDDDRSVVFMIIATMLTKKKFKDFFNKNIADL
jgi:hypothetical protein